MRWLHNNDITLVAPSDWNTPPFVQIKKMKTKRLSRYAESEIWDLEDLTNNQVQTQQAEQSGGRLLWDFNARPHEITLLKIKHIRLRERYGEAEIPHDSKTGSGPAMLTLSLTYVRDWLNEHPI